MIKLVLLSKQHGANQKLLYLRNPGDQVVAMAELLEDRRLDRAAERVRRPRVAVLLPCGAGLSRLLGVSETRSMVQRCHNRPCAVVPAGLISRPMGSSYSRHLATKNLYT